MSADEEISTDGEDTMSNGMRSDLNESDQKLYDGIAAACAGLENMMLPETPADYVADNGPAADGSLVVNVRLVDGRMVHLCFEEGQPIKMKIFDK